MSHLGILADLAMDVTAAVVVLVPMLMVVVMAVGAAFAALALSSRPTAAVRTARRVNMVRLP